MTTAIATKQEQNVESRNDTFKGFLVQKKTEIEAVLPAHVTFEKFQRVVLTAISMNNDLLSDGKSLFQSCVQCAADGLMPDGKEAALVIFNTKDKKTDTWHKKVLYMPMVKGLIKLARNSGEVSNLTAQIVCQNDTFNIDLASDERPTHKVNLEKTRGDMIAAYAIATFKDGTFQCEIMSKEEIDKIKSISKGIKKNNAGEEYGIWVDWYEEMARKTVLKRLMKYLSLSPELVRVIDTDNSMYDLSQLAARPTRPALPTNLSEDWIPIADQSNNEEDIDETYGVADYSHDVRLAKSFDDLVNATTKLITSPSWIDLKAQGQANVLKNITGPATKEIGLPEFDALAEVNDSIYLCVMWGTDSKEILNNVDDLLLKQEGLISPDILAIKAIRIAEFKAGKKADESALI